MGEIAEMMLDGTLCEGCGEFIDHGGGDGIPRYCSPQCAADRGAEYFPPSEDEDGRWADREWLDALTRKAPAQPPNPARRIACTLCGRKCRGKHGLRDHMRDKHGEG
jgi:hypothetical protein